MAYEYRLPVIDIDGAIKAVQDNAFRQEQLRLKYEESMNKSIDDQQKLYNGKVRKQDVAEFDSKFAVYADAQKRYQALNRRGGRGGDLTAAKVLADEAKADMLGYVGDSSGLGQMQIGVGKMFKDPTKVINTKKYTEVFTDLSSMSTGELKEKYGGIDKIPTNFEFKQEDYGPDKVTKFSNSIKSVLPISAQSSLSRPIPAINPNTGQQKMAQKSITFQGKSLTVDVPINIIKAGIDPITTLNSVIAAGSQDQETVDYMKALQKDLYQSAEDAANPQVQKEAQDRIQRTMDMFGIKDKANLNQFHLFAANYVDQNRMGDIEIEDWSKLDDIASMFTKANGLKLDDLQMKKLKKEISESSNPSGMKTLSQLLSIYTKAVATGLTNDEQWASQFETIFKQQGYPMDKATILKAGQGVFIQNQNLINAMFPGTPPPPANIRK